MPNYRLNKAAMRHAEQLIRDGKVDADTDWSTAAPSAQDENKEIDSNGWDGFAQWHLAVNPDASEETKRRYAFPYGDFRKVNRAAVIHAKQRASQNDHDEIEQAADELLKKIDAE
jgi:hypothetical protein